MAANAYWWAVHLSAERGKHIYCDAKKLTPKHWGFLTAANLKKANFIISKNPISAPIHDQSLIAKQQLEEYFPREEVSVLSAFPVFVADYFGKNPLEEE